ncbi:MAG: hypothetical protein U5J83_12595 [Bryobacterales bacterium]|nr:hypothetical protein [Bryobacterales bacterium]
MSHKLNSTTELAGSNLFEFPANKLTPHQQCALEALRQGKSVTAIMDELDYQRQTFYDWRNANPAFRLAVEEARDTFRGVVADCVHDLQQTVHVLLDDCIRANHIPLSTRLRAAGLFLRYARSETLLPRRLSTIVGALDGISPSSPSQGPSSPAPNPAPPPSEPLEPSSPPSPHPPANPSRPQPQKTDESVRSVRFASPEDPPASPSDSSIPATANQSAPQSEAKHSPPEPEPRIPEPGFPSAAPSLDPLPSPSAANDPPETVLSQHWLGKTFLHKHESPKAFERLLDNHIRAYQPATPPEELLVFRIAQKAWVLRRLETWERVIADSSVAKVRAKNPNAAAPACIAMALLERKDTAQTLFYERTAKLRKEYEDALDRLTAKLQILEDRRHRKHLQFHSEFHSEFHSANPFPPARPHIPFAQAAIAPSSNPSSAQDDFSKSRTGAKR